MAQKRWGNRWTGGTEPKPAAPTDRATALKQLDLNDTSSRTPLDQQRLRFEALKRLYL